jgi:hypothetical protein
MFRASFADVQFTDGVKVLVFDGRFPAFECFIRFLGDDTKCKKAVRTGMGGYYQFTYKITILSDI